MGIAQLDRAFFYDRTSLRQNASPASQHTNSRCKLLKIFALIWKYLMICNVFCYSSVCGGKSLRSVSEADLPSSSACTGHNCLQLDQYLRCFLKNTCLKVIKIKIIIFALQLYLQALNTIVSNLNPCSEDEEIRCFWKLLKLMEIIFIIIFALQLYLQLYLHWTKLSPTKFHVKSMKSFGKIFV